MGIDLLSTGKGSLEENIKESRMRQLEGIYESIQEGSNSNRA